MDASVRYVVDPGTAHAGDGGFKPALCIRGTQWAHCVINSDIGIRITKIPVRDHDHAPPVLLAGAPYPIEKCAQLFLDATARTVARRDITIKACRLLEGVLTGSITPEAIEAPDEPEAAPESSPKAPKGASQGCLATICAELCLDPPVARRLLRKAGLHAPYDDATKIRSVLQQKGDAK